MITHGRDLTPAELRNFGLIIGGIFSAIAFWPMLARAEDLRLWALVASIILIVPALVFPGSLRPVHKAWMRIGEALGWFNTRILLGIVFYGLLTPMGLIMRLFGKDSMRRQFVQEAHTYRVMRKPRPHSHMMRQF